MVLYELLYGAERSNDPPRLRREVEHFAARLTVMSFDSDAAAHTADARADLEKRRWVIGSYDLMIAGHARSRGLIVVTGNLGVFQRVRGYDARTGWQRDAHDAVCAALKGGSMRRLASGGPVSVNRPLIHDTRRPCHG